MASDYDAYGLRRAKRYEERIPLTEIKGMFSPAKCAYCQTIYDLGQVTVLARYADCSVWKCPGCNQTVDDRGETGWKSIKDYYPIDRAGRVKR